MTEPKKSSLNNMVVETLKGLWKENPIFVQLLGICSTLAITNKLVNGIAMGLATTFVLVCSNFMISVLRSYIPKEIRIPSYIVVIATFVTMADIYLKANFLDISNALGPFIPLIVVNCIILGRAESFASKNNPILSLCDGLGMGLGFCLVLITISSIREILGSGTILGFTVLGSWYQPWLIMVLPPGAFFVMGCLVALMQKIKEKDKC
jgi:electron transport complex protein RnfE